MTARVTPLIRNWDRVSGRNAIAKMTVAMRAMVA